MANIRRKSKWSLLLIRDADRRVRQFRISGKTVAFLPVAAAVAVAGALAGTELRALQRIQTLEDLLGVRASDHRSDRAAKAEEIDRLKRELAQAEGRNAALESRMNELAELEAKLRRFVGSYANGSADAAGTSPPGDATPRDFGHGTPRSEIAASSASVFSSSPLAFAGARSGDSAFSGEDASPSASDRLSAAAVESTIADFAELSRMLGEVADSMEESLRKAERRRAEQDAIPSRWPTVSRKLTSGFGYRSDPFTGVAAFHAGADIDGDVGDPIFAAGDGSVKETGFNRTRGNYIIIAHRNGLESWYMHLNRIGVEEGRKVGRGERIGEMGNTGRSTGPHLHFQIVASGEPVNPLAYLEKVEED